MSTHGIGPVSADDLAEPRPSAFQGGICPGHNGGSVRPLAGQGTDTPSTISPIPNHGAAIRKLQIDVGHLQDCVDDIRNLLRDIITELGDSDDSEQEEHREPCSPMEFTSINNGDRSKQPFKKRFTRKY